MLATFFSASYTSLPFLPCLPIFLIGTKMLNPEPLSARDNSLPGRLTKLAVFGATWCSCALTLGCTLTLPLHLALQTPLVSSYHSLFIYTPFLIIGLRKDHNATYGPFTRLLFHPTFDAPLLLAGFILRETPLNLRLFGPFATILDANIVQGSLPYPSDAKILAAEPYNVVAVVNMCLEYPGPVESYAAAGITQLRLPHVDTCAPRVGDLRLGAAFVKKMLAENPGKRVFIHCKGGIGRASTMSLAHYIVNEGKDPVTQIEWIRGKRSVAMREICEYECLRTLWREEGGKEGERKKL